LKDQEILTTDLERLVSIHRQRLSAFPEAGQLATRPVPVGSALEGVLPDLAPLQLEVLSQQMQRLEPSATSLLGVVRVAAFYYIGLVRTSLFSIGNHALAEFLVDLYLKKRTGSEGKFRLTECGYRRLSAMGWALQNLGPLSHVMGLTRGIKEPCAVYLPMPYRVTPVADRKPVNEAYEETVLDGPSAMGLTRFSLGSPLVTRKWFAGFRWDGIEEDPFTRFSHSPEAAQIVRDAAGQDLTPGEVAIKLGAIGPRLCFRFDKSLSPENYQKIAVEIFAPALCYMVPSKKDRFIRELLNVILRFSNPAELERNPAGLERSKADLNELFVASLRKAPQINLESFTPLQMPKNGAALKPELRPGTSPVHRLTRRSKPC
jgi:hypothetical protein